MSADWITTSWAAVPAVALSTIGIYLVLLVCTRLAGLRSFAQMSSFDLAVNIAVGSIIATTAISREVSLAEGALGIAVLFGVQAAIATIRRFGFATDMVNNRSLLLMDGPEFIEDHLRRGRITKNDVRFKLREANVFDYDEIRAVVLETTGEISVLHTSGDRAVNADIVADVIGAERLAAETRPPDGGTDPPR